jgi:hypothetical protein
MISVIQTATTSLDTSVWSVASTDPKRPVKRKEVLRPAPWTNVADIGLSSSQSQSSSTNITIYSKELYSKLEALFRAGKEEVFEDGMESSFSKELTMLIRKYGNAAVEVITCLIVYEKVTPEVAGEALRWIGYTEHTESYLYRRWLLERSLSLPSARVQDGATLGLAAMDDRHAIPYLKHAIEQETCAELRDDMEQVVEQLERLN